MFVGPLSMTKLSTGLNLFSYVVIHPVLVLCRETPRHHHTVVTFFLWGELTVS